MSKNAAERRIENRIADRLNDETKEQLDALLTKIVDGKISRFFWLRQFEVGNNSAGASRFLGDVPPYRVTRLRRQGERYFADDLRDISSDPPLAILAVCAIEWAAADADALIETPADCFAIACRAMHDRIVGKNLAGGQETVRGADCRCQIIPAGNVAILQDLGAALLEAKGDGASRDEATETACGWAHLESMVATAAELADMMAADALTHVIHGYHRFRRYAPACCLR